jgi:alanyl-tRNA synthetase
MSGSHLTKDGLRKQFSRDWKKHYNVSIFKENGFERKTCKTCGKAFWTLDPERKSCADSSCQSYDFIGSPRTSKKLDYIETWKLFERFFKKNEHTSIPRYPVIDRVRPDLFFTIASIQDFQRLDRGNMIFVYPENPLVVPQVCLRFPDISSVGLSGRHLTSFVMPGQHAFGYPKKGYFKDRCMELNFQFLTKEMGIPEKELVYMEDVWSMPDFSAFGPSIETTSLGLELVNHVFMQFQKSDTGKGFKDLDIKVNDTGWGHERLVWFSNGTHTMYDCIFGPLIHNLKKKSGIKTDPEIFMKYSKLAGTLDVDEIGDINSARQKIAKSIGVSVSELKEQIEPMQALYAITDHMRTLLFAVTDGGIPSNVGGGYNLRVLLRRSLSFLKQHNFNFDIMGVAEQHAKYLKPMFPELKQGLEPMKKILDVESERYEKTTNNARKTLERMMRKGEHFSEEKLVKLYESQGISPDTVREITKADIPVDIYAKITEKHQSRQDAEEAEKINLSGLPETRALFYTKPGEKTFTAKVLKVIGNRVVLNKSAFYAEAGGQEADHGVLKTKKGEFKVRGVQKIGGVFLHDIENPKLKAGESVRGEIDWKRRDQLSKHHTAIHIINAAAREVLGRHIWQAGSGKSTEKAHLDITHYLPITEQERNKIEEIANRTVKKSIAVTTEWMSRQDAEKKYGFRLYQGGAVPGKEIRVIGIKGIDVEACGGIHRTNTSEVGRIVITSTDRIQDGVDRITIKAGEAAESQLDEDMDRVHNMVSFVRKDMKFIELPKNITEHIDKDSAAEQLKNIAVVFSVPINDIENTIKRFCQEIIDNCDELNRIRKRLHQSKRSLGDYLKAEKTKDLEETFKIVFNVWKQQKKEIEKLRAELANSEARKLVSKIKNGQLFEVIGLDRKELIAIAGELISTHAGLTVILSNQAGDVVGMTRNKKKDMNKVIKDMCTRAGGSGGGTKDFAQGRADLSKLLKVAGRM